MDNAFRSQIEEYVREAHNDPRTTCELISEALGDPDGHTGWDAVSILHRRGTRDVFEAARRLCRSDCPVERALGANILGQLGVPDRNFPGEVIAVLRRLLETETDAGVLSSACVALCHTPGNEAIPALCGLKSHPIAEVRYGVAFALQNQTTNLAVETLIELTADADDGVRDWATFALGTQIEADTPEIREALVRRTADADETVRGEALVGLARRRDERVIEPLLRELARYPGTGPELFAVQAAELIADPRLLPALIQLRQSVEADDPTFDEAVVRCSGR